MTLEDKMAEFDRQVRSTEYDIQVYLPIYTFPIQFLLLRDLRRETRRYSQKVSAQLARQIQKLVITSDSSLKTRMLMRTYKCRKFRELMDSIPEGKQVEFVESIGSVAYNSMSGGATRTYVNLASQDPSKIEKSIDIARRVGKIAPVADFRPVTRSLMQLVKGKDIQYAHEIITKCEAFAYSTIGGGANSKLSKIYRLKEFKSLFEWPVASLEAIGQGFQSVWDLVHIRKYLSLCHELPQFEPHVYWELGRFYNFCDRKKLSFIVNDENDFLNQQKSETVVPLLKIMYELDQKYHPQIKELDENSKQDLAKAYSIARENKDEANRKNYLPEFYDGLKDCLEERPEMLGRWAASIVSDFRKQGEEGLLRWVGW